MPSLIHNRQPVDIALLEDVILPEVFKPARYVGMEQGAYKKPFEKTKATFCMAFPDLYEIGISNYGVKLFYSLINNHPDYMADRVYAPAPDMREKLKEHNFPLYGVESMQPLRNFDVLAFTLQYELNYSTILGVLEAAQIPLRSTDRDDTYPLIIAGGPGSANPMPLAPFFDAFIIGDGEEILIEIMDLMATYRCHSEAKGRGIPSGPQEIPRSARNDMLQELAKIPGIFIPGVTEKADKRIVDIAEHPVEIAPLTPAIQAVHDRVVIEARRGCDRMCRFCQPCFINLPVREQNVETIKEKALKEIEKTGYEECSLLSLSIADYSYFRPLILEVAEALEEEGVSLSLPSQRADRFSLDVAEAVQSVRKSTLTFAPEAGTKRLRDVINKNLSDEEIMDAVTTAYKAGWNKVKLYFIIGLPTETLDDLDGIHDIVKRLQEACNEIKRDPQLSIKKFLEINVTLSNFVPKPHTPFQWFPQDTMEMLRSKKAYIRDRFKDIRGVKLNFTDPEISKLEAVISKGGPELADVIESVYKKGAYLDAWDDMLNFDRWFEALKEHGIDHEAYTRERCVNTDDALPWDVIDMGLTKQWLVDEYEKAKQAGATVPCFEACSTCGVCANYGTWPKFTDTKLIEARDKREREKQKAQQIHDEITPKNDEKSVKNSEKTAKNTQKTADFDAKTGQKTVNSSLQSDAHKLKKSAVCKVRIRIEKRGKLKFLSHLDWLRMIHRAVIRSGIPVAYSQGFNPHPKISFGPALPLFTEALGEFVDIELSKPINDVCSRLNPHLPEGGKALAESLVPVGSKSIEASVKTLTYTASLCNINPSGSTGQTTCATPESRYTIIDRVEELSSQPVIPIEIDAKPTRHQHRNKLLDIKPYLADLRVEDERTVTFRLNWLKSHANSGNTPDQGNNRQPHSIKPSWLLGLLQPDAAGFDNRWTLVRTHIELE